MNRLICIFLTLFALLMAGCLGNSSQWNWKHPDTEYAELNRQVDIDDCEKESLEMGSLTPLRHQTARPHGGWGETNFEFCMEQRGWKLQKAEKPAE